MAILWHCAVASGAVVVGIGVVVALAQKIRRLRSPDPELAADEGLIAHARPANVFAIQTDPLLKVRAVVFDSDAVVEISDRRDPWRQIARRSSRWLDPRTFCGSLEDYAAACGVAWEPAWAEDEEVELKSIRVRDGTFETFNALRANGYRIGVMGKVPWPYTTALRSVLDTTFDAQVYSSQKHIWRLGRPMLAMLCAEMDLSPKAVLIVRGVGRNVEGPLEFGMLGLVVDPGNPGIPNHVGSLPEVVERLHAARRRDASSAHSASGQPLSPKIGHKPQERRNE